jgi:hypothetical protein
VTDGGAGAKMWPSSHTVMRERVEMVKRNRPNNTLQTDGGHNRPVLGSVGPRLPAAAEREPLGQRN